MGNRFTKLTRDQTIHSINGFATREEPFVFLISFSEDGNLVMPPREAESSGFYLEMPGLVNHTLEKSESLPVNLVKHPVARERYQDAFSYVTDQILYGNSFLLNLTFPTQIETNYGLQDVFTRSVAPFKLFLEDQLVVFSPERFIRIQGRSISSNPMKGTMDASIPGAYRLLASDPKEDGEHNTIVDLIRNDLSMVAGNVRVKRFKYIEKIRTHQGELLQMSSEITGRLPENYRKQLGELLFRLLPAGSICGAPKKKTVEIIRKAEGYERGFYTGVFGHFDGKNLDSAVAIRYIEKQGEQLVFKSGGGITFQSDCEKEYDEMLKKIYVPVF
jgi:para-aminobenzoate synthetase component 1